MPNVLPGEGIGPQGTRDVNALLTGSWSYIGVVDAGTEFELGACPEGQLEISREELRHQNTAFPRMTDLWIPTQVGMAFTCNIEEFHKQNMHLLVGDAVADTSNYIYIGDRKDCDFFTFSAKRERVCDGRTLEVYMWKCITNGLVQVGSGDDWISSPATFTALDDTDNNFGGGPTAPLGYLFVPDRLS